jgi:hypothetical protein
MAVIQKFIRLVGSKGSQEEVAIFDSGFTYSCIQSELAEKLEIVVPLPKPMDFGTAKEGETLTATERVSINSTWTATASLMSSCSSPACLNRPSSVQPHCRSGG